MQTADFPLAGHFLESTPEPALIKAADGTYLFINAAFERAFGVKNSDVIGRKADELWGDYITENASRSDADIIANGDTMS